MTCVVLVDDDKNTLKALNRALSRRHKYTIKTFDSPDMALKWAATADFDVIISDYRMPEMDGISLLRSIKQIKPDAIRILLTGHSDRNALYGAINEAEVFRFVEKPFDDEAIGNIVDSAFQRMIENLSREERLSPL